jgi:hypothetical protein
MTAYATRPATAQAVQWRGTNLAEIADLAGDDLLGAYSGRLWVINAEGPCKVRSGWWVTREPGQPLMVHSQAAFARFWEPA